MLFHWFLFLFGLNIKLSQSQHISAQGKLNISEMLQEDMSHVST